MILMLLACGGPRDGSAVGNPGNAGFTLGDVPTDVELEVGELEVKAFGLRSPIFRSEDPAYGVHDDFDLLDDTPWLYVPSGRWTGIEAMTGNPSILLEGTTDALEFCMELPLGKLEVDETIRVDGQDFWVSLDVDRVLQPAFLHARAEDGFLYIGPEDPLAEVLAELIRQDVDLDIQ